MSTCSYVSMKSEFFYEHFNKAYTYFPHPLYSHTKKDAQVAHPFFSYSDIKIQQSNEVNPENGTPIKTPKPLVP